MKHWVTLSLAMCYAHGVLAQPKLPVAATNDTAGFTTIFDGRTLTGWQGDPTYWRVEDGCLVGEVTLETLLTNNSFLIWQGGTARDFELKLQYRISDEGNSGVNYRSEIWTTAPFALRGYQADIDGALRHTGQNYEEKGRTFLALRGDVSRVDEDGKARVIGSVGDKTELARYIRTRDWNEYHLIVRGNVLIHALNGQVMSMVVDDDPEGRRMDGLIGVQVHVGPPMMVEFRNIRLKRLGESGGDAGP